ncbi:MAG: hypothetical protein S4CHLAM123_07250 [Chlamydiales bacterium]|nr:hypothetical protein [Chlamydiales bacterium]
MISPMATRATMTPKRPKSATKKALKELIKIDSLRPFTGVPTLKKAMDLECMLWVKKMSTRKEVQIFPYQFEVQVRNVSCAPLQ